jgi:hypothetical protein
MLSYASHRHNPDTRIGDETPAAENIVQCRPAAASLSAAHSRITMPRIAPATPQL